MRPARNRGGKALGLPALKKSLFERKMRNKTVNDPRANAGIIRMRVDAIFCRVIAREESLAGFIWRQLVLCSWLKLSCESLADAPNLDIYTP